MTILLWILVGFFVLGALTTVSQIGKDRKPITPETAAVVVLGDMLLISALLVSIVRGW